MSDDTAHPDRRTVLRQLGVTLAVGLGLAGAAGAADAAPRRGSSKRHQDQQHQGQQRAVVSYKCCTAPVRCGECSGNVKVRYRCRSDQCPDYCTTCIDFRGDCYSFTAPTCA